MLLELGDVVQGARFPQRSGGKSVTLRRSKPGRHLFPDRPKFVVCHILPVQEKNAKDCKLPLSEISLILFKKNAFQ